LRLKPEFEIYLYLPVSASFPSDIRSLGKDAETGKYKYISNSGFKRKSDAKHHAEMVERQLSNRQQPV
jgi:hypothetical protein